MLAYIPAASTGADAIRRGHRERPGGVEFRRDLAAWRGGRDLVVCRPPAGGKHRANPRHDSPWAATICVMRVGSVPLPSAGGPCAIDLRTDHGSELRWRTPDGGQDSEIIRPLRAIPGGSIRSNPRWRPLRKWWSPNLIYAARAKGAYITDLDGNEFLDYHCASGSIFLGYSNPEVDEAVIDVIRNHGNQFALPHQFEIDLASKLREHIPSAEMIAFSNAGTDTMQFALRVSRGYTGRSKIVKFEGGYQGWADSVAVSVTPDRADAGSERAPNVVPGTTGIPSEVLATMLVCPYNDAEAVAETFDAHRNSIAALVVEPYVHGTNLRPKPGFLAALRRLCDEAGWC